MDLTLDPHPLLDLRALQAAWPVPVAEVPEPTGLADLLRADAQAPLKPDEIVNKAVRDLLRQGGYKPTGRGKPSSEYLQRAAAEEGLPRINPAVDVGNAVSLHSGLPISVVDLDKAVPPLRVGLGAPGERYVFNQAGHDIDVEGLLVLRDAQGPCANAVKDAQRTKTGEGTRRVLVLVWGSKSLPGRADRTLQWLADLLRASGAEVAVVP